MEAAKRMEGFEVLRQLADTRAHDAEIRMRRKPGQALFIEHSVRFNRGHLQSGSKQQFRIPAATRSYLYDMIARAQAYIRKDIIENGLVVSVSIAGVHVGVAFRVTV